ncbi:unnamed protein product, partial [marine sediment metagenome]
GTQDRRPTYYHKGDEGLSSAKGGDMDCQWIY